MAQVSPTFYSTLEADLGIPASATPILQAWQQAEGGTAAFNPFNTTRATDQFGNNVAVGSYNSVGVRIFPTEAAGIAATEATIKQKNFSGILAALQGGSAPQFESALATEPWGTNPSTVAGILKSPMPSIPSTSAAPGSVSSAGSSASATPTPPITGILKSIDHVLNVDGAINLLNPVADLKVIVARSAFIGVGLVLGIAGLMLTIGSIGAKTVDVVNSVPGGKTITKAATTLAAVA